jgi:hypothetical protein
MVERLQLYGGEDVTQGLSFEEKRDEKIVQRRWRNVGSKLKLRSGARQK